MEYWHLKVGEEIFIFTDKRFVCRDIQQMSLKSKMAYKVDRV